jgi:hypothetical protein
VKWRNAALAAGAVMGSATAVQQAPTVRDRRPFPPPGLLVSLDGHPMSLKVRGHDVDEPTVVLRREWVCFSPNWHWVQEEFAPTVRSSRTTGQDLAEAGRVAGNAMPRQLRWSYGIRPAIGALSKHQRKEDA